MRETGHLDISFISVGFAGLDDPKHLADKHRVVRIRLIKIPHPVKQHSLGMLGFHREKLLDQRGIFGSLAFHHLKRFYYYKFTNFIRIVYFYMLESL